MFNFTFISIKLETNTEVVYPTHVTYSPHSLCALTEAEFHRISELVPSLLVSQTKG